MATIMAIILVAVAVVAVAIFVYYYPTLGISKVAAGYLEAVVQAHRSLTVQAHEQKAEYLRIRAGQMSRDIERYKRTRNLEDG